MHNNCLECGDEILYGRNDRKFCSGNCKNAYNNRLASLGPGGKRKIVSKIESNYAILRTLVLLGRTSVTLSELEQLGYDKKYVTFHDKVKGHDMFMCFDISYFQTASRIFSISRITSVSEGL